MILDGLILSKLLIETDVKFQASTLIRDCYTTLLNCFSSRLSNEKKIACIYERKGIPAGILSGNIQLYVISKECRIRTFRGMNKILKYM